LTTGDSVVIVAAADGESARGIGDLGVIRFSLLGSGSSGNAIFVRAAHTKLLIDCGLSLRQLRLRLATLGESLDGLTGVAITHEHGDHIQGLRTLARQYKVPVYLTPDTAARVTEKVGPLENQIHFNAGDTIPIGEFALQSFSVEHDAVDPVSFVISGNGCRLGMATDLGHVTGLVRERLSGAHALVLESNYCPEMIERSSYPIEIVQRIKSRRGHLSNHDMNSLLAHLLHDDLQLVVAIHVSQENNTEAKARAMALQAMRGHPADLFVAAQDAPTPLFTIAPRAVMGLAPDRVLERTA
jgi:phosphoribosyl 1,2-cyclic phosphodiesterase